MDRITQLLNEVGRGRTDDICRGRFMTMYVGSEKFSDVACWLSGFDFANGIAFPDEVSSFCGFKEWLLIRIGGNCCYVWQSLIEEKYGDGLEASKRFFELFNDFRRDVDERGLRNVLKEHYDFEVETYGGPRVSQYYSRGWDKR